MISDTTPTANRKLFDKEYEEYDCVDNMFMME